jgi:TolA-binding protein
LAPTSGELTFTTFGKASTFDMPPKKALVLRAAL